MTSSMLKTKISRQLTIPDFSKFGNFQNSWYSQLQVTVKILGDQKYSHVLLLTDNCPDNFDPLTAISLLASLFKIKRTFVLHFPCSISCTLRMKVITFYNRK